MTDTGGSMESRLDDQLRAEGWEPCPFEAGCITWIKPDDTVGLETHQREWHPQLGRRESRRLRKAEGPAVIDYPCAQCGEPVETKDAPEFFHQDDCDGECHCTLVTHGRCAEEYRRFRAGKDQP